MTAPPDRSAYAAEPDDPIRAISLDFGNTLVPITGPALRSVVERMTADVVARSGPFEPAAFVAAWAEERQRQFAEEVPELREVDLAQRTTRVLARLRGMHPPPTDRRWDDAAAARRSDPDEIAFALDRYSAAFVATIPAPPAIGPLLARLAERFTVGICSNWPLAATIDRFVEAAGWAPSLTAVVVSERVGAIKPDRRFFRIAEAALGASPGAILHAGDDWAADVVGATRAGWRVAYVRSRPIDSPLPDSEPDRALVPDLTLDRIEQLEDGLAGLIA